MPHSLYMDVHVPSAITSGLRRRGINVLTSQEDGTATLADEPLLKRSTELNRILFSQDDDLLAIASEWQANEREFCGLIYCHQLSTGVGRIIEDVELIATCAADEEVRSRVIYVPLQ